MNRIYFILFLIIGILVIFFGRAIGVMQQKPFIPQSISFSLPAPSESLMGKFTQTEGTILKQSREGGGFKPLPDDSKLWQGESLQTKDGFVQVRFDNFALVTTSEDTQIALVSAIPANFLIKQSTGKVRYTLQSDKPLSVRSFHMLFELQEGEAVVQVVTEKNQIIITSKGKGKVAMDDTDNNTHVWKVEKGDMVTIDDDGRTVKIR